MKIEFHFPKPNQILIFGFKTLVFNFQNQNTNIHVLK